MFVSVIVAAGGAGTRLGGATPKQLLDIGGQSMLARSIRAFDAHPRVSEIIVVLPAAAVNEAIVSTKPTHVVAGGPRRQDSVANRVARLPPRAKVVIAQYAARPF